MDVPAKSSFRISRLSARGWGIRQGKCHLLRSLRSGQEPLLCNTPAPHEAFLACYTHAGATSMAQLCFQPQAGLSDGPGKEGSRKGRKQEKQPSLGVSLQSRSRESLSVQDLEQRNAGALIIVSAAVVEMPLTLASALVRIIITLEDPRQPSKLISCLCRVDGFFFSSLWVISRAVGDGGNPVGGSPPGWMCTSRKLN